MQVYAQFLKLCIYAYGHDFLRWKGHITDVTFRSRGHPLTLDPLGWGATTWDWILEGGRVFRMGKKLLMEYIGEFEAILKPALRPILFRGSGMVCDGKSRVKKYRDTVPKVGTVYPHKSI
jgi:hypothetical protein